MSSSNENNIFFSISGEERNNLDLSNFHPVQNTISSLSPINSLILHEPNSLPFNLFDENPDYLSQHDNHSYNLSPIPQNISNDVYDEPQNDILFQNSYMAIPNDYNILNINPSQNDVDYAAQKANIEKENAIQIEGKFFLNYILIALETDGITFTFKPEEKKNKFKTENTLLNKKHKRCEKKNKKKVYYKQFKREDLNKIIQESNLPQELKREIHKPNINKFIEKFKESPYFFENLRDFNFKDIYTFGKEAEELPRLNDEAISEFLEYCQKIGEKNLDENLAKIKIFFQIKIGDLFPKNWRLDYCIKHIKTAISKYGTKILNKLISESDLPKIYKNKINKPDHTLFTAKDSIKDNNKFLTKLLKEIYTIGKNIETNPKENHENFLNIFKYFKQVGINDLPENLQNILNFLEMTYEDLIKNFYDSEEFKDFKVDIKAQFYEYGIEKKRKSKGNNNLSILKDYGLIKIFKIK